MSIQIIEDLAVRQEEITLPMRIDLSQTLKSSEPEEEVTVRYSVDPDAHVWLKDEVNDKTEIRQETIRNTNTEINHRLTLVAGEGEVVERLAIEQTITDSLGIETTDRTFVVINP